MIYTPIYILQHNSSKTIVFIKKTWFSLIMKQILRKRIDMLLMSSDTMTPTHAYDKAITELLEQIDINTENMTISEKEYTFNKCY